MMGELLAQVDAGLSRIDVDELKREGFLPPPHEAYLTGTYPPLKAMRRISAAEVFIDASPVVSLYVHIPFCWQRCTFCHFAKEINARPAKVRAYLDALAGEARLVSRSLGDGRRVASVYIGGGTPSSLEPAETNRLLATISEFFGVTSQTEFTFELHPQVVREPKRFREQFRVLMAGGVNRIAFGAQTLDDRILRVLNRGHSADDVRCLIDFLQGSAFDNYSVDLMYGLPHESLEGWRATLVELVDRGVSKLNVFPLFFKVTDPISALYEHRPEVFPDAQSRLRTHFLTEAYLTSQGFVRGPVLYYSRGDRHSLQQELKFNDIDSVNLVGLGVSSFGYVGRTQYYNVCSIDDYVALAGRAEFAVWRGETLDAEESARRAIMFELRAAGVSERRFLARFGRAPEQMFPELRRFADLGLVTRRDGVWVATDIGSCCLDGMASKLASDRVKRRVAQTNRCLSEPRRSLIEQHDYSPLGRTGASIPQPQRRRT